MPLVTPKVVLTKCKTAGRCGTGAVKAVILHEISKDIDSVIQDARRCCDRGCESSLHYVVDNVTGVVYQFVPEADTAWGFAWTAPTTPANFAPPCPDTIAACDPCTVLTTDAIFAGEAAPLDALDPNCFVIHVGISLPIIQTEGIPVTDGCGTATPDCPLTERITPAAYSNLVKLLCDVFSRFPLLPKNATTLRQFGTGLTDLDIAQLIVDINACPVAAAPFNRLCNDLRAFPAGVPVTVFGVDATGACVAGPAGAVVAVNDDQVLTAGVSSSALVTLTPSAPVGPDNQVNYTVRVDVTVSPAAGNQLQSLPTGLFVPAFDLCATIAALPLAVAVPGTTAFLGADCQRYTLPVSSFTLAANSGPSQTISGGDTLSVLGSAALGTNTVASATDTVTVGVQLSAAVGNAASLLADGLFVSPLCTQLAAVAVGVQAVGDSVLAINGGVCKLVPFDSLCVQLNALDTATDATVPATADIIYVRADGSCGRAPSATTAGFRVTQALPLGTTTITHNLNLAGPLFASIVEVRNAIDGAIITARVIPGSETANTLQIDVGAAVASAKITVLSS